MHTFWGFLLLLTDTGNVGCVSIVLIGYIKPIKKLYDEITERCIESAI